MIRVEWDPYALRLRVDGHAGFAQPGEDIVCAAASMLVYTLAADLRELCRMEPESFALDTLRLDAGAAEIALRAAEDRRDLAALVFVSVCTGFSLLAAKYPESVTSEQRTSEQRCNVMRSPPGRKAESASTDSIVLP